MFLDRAIRGAAQVAHNISIKKDRLAAVLPKSYRNLNQAAMATAFFRFRRQPNRPAAPRPVANNGRAAGNGVVAAVPIVSVSANCRPSWYCASAENPPKSRKKRGSTGEPALKK